MTASLERLEKAIMYQAQYQPDQVLFRNMIGREFATESAWIHQFLQEYVND